MAALQFPTNPTLGQQYIIEGRIYEWDGDSWISRYEYDPNEVLFSLLQVDGTNSLLDSDLLDGQTGSWYVDWNNTTNKPDPIINLTGDASGSVTLTDLASQQFNLAVTVLNDSHTHDNRYYTETEANTRFLNVTGDSMTGGDITLFQDPTAAMHATTKQYVDSSITSGVVTSASKWTTARTISLGGDLGGSVSFDGSANFVLSATIQPNSVALGGDTTGAFVADVVAGTAITLSETASGAENNTVTVNHADTSTQASVNNSNGVVIQDITLDGMGHITGLGSIDLDGRYYTETEADGRFVNVTGDTMTGNLSFNTTGTGIDWTMNTDGASIKFYNTGDGDTNSRLEFNVRDNANEDFLFTGTAGGTTTELLRISPDGGVDGMKFRGHTVYHAGNTGSGSGLNADTIDGIDSSQFLRSDQDDTTTGRITIATTAPVLILNDTDATTNTNQYGWISFQRQGTESGWVGFGSATNSDVTLQNNGGNVNLVPTSGFAQVNGQRIFAEDYHPNADKWTTARTLTLGSNLIGNVTFDGSSNFTLNGTVDLTAGKDVPVFVEQEISKSIPVGSIGQVPFIKTDSTRETELDYLLSVGQFVENAEEMAQAQGNIVDNSTIFSTWYRFSHNNTNVYPANPSEINNWSYNAGTDTITCTINSATHIGFVSDSVYTDYVLETDLSSTDADNDMIGVVVAFHDDGVREHTITAVRTRSLEVHMDVPTGSGTVRQWALVYNFRQVDAKVLAWASIAGDTQGAWSTSGGTRVRINRAGDIITADASPFGSTTYAGAAQLVIDLTADPDLAKFRGARSYGFSCMSQNSSSFQTVSFSESANVIYDLQTGNVLEYNGTAWVATGETIWNASGRGRFVYNEFSGKTFYLTHDDQVISVGAGDIPAATFVGDTAPASPQDGQLWFDSGTSGSLYIWLDGSQAWLDVSSIVFSPDQTFDSVTTSELSVGSKITKNLGGTADYYRYVIPLVQLTGWTDPSSESSFHGQLRAWRGNALYQPMVINIMAQRIYNTNNYQLTFDQHGTFTGLNPITFNYGGQTYLGVQLAQSDAQAYGGVWIDGWRQGLGVAPQLLPYYNNLTATVLNTEVNSSITSITGSVGQHLFGGPIISRGDVTAYSDARLKSNVETITDAVDKVKQLRGVSYTRIDTGEDKIGVIAQEVEQVLPEVVNDPLTENGYKSVAYGNMVGVLIEAIKEQQEQIDVLKAEIKELREK